MARFSVIITLGLPPVVNRAFLNEADLEAALRAKEMVAAA